MDRRPDSALAGFSVLVTRPDGRADELVAALRGAGAEVAHVPLLAIAPLDEVADAAACQQLRQRLLDLDRYHRVIVVSVTAVEHGFDWIRRYWPQLPVGIRWYGIGAATVAALAAEDVSAAAPTASMTTEALLLEPDFASLTGERVLVLRGIGGRPALAEAMTARGARVDFAECYHRRPPQLTPVQTAKLNSSRFDVVSIHSGETLEYFAACIADSHPRLRDALLVVPSERVAAAARARGFPRVVAAANAGSVATLAATIEALAATGPAHHDLPATDSPASTGIDHSRD